MDSTTLLGRAAQAFMDLSNERFLQGEVPEQDLSALVAGGIIVAVTGLLILFYLYEFWMDRYVAVNHSKHLR